MAKRKMIGVSARFARAPSGKEHFDRTAILAAEIIEIRNVVVGLIAEARQVVAHAQLARFLIALQRSSELIQADEAHGHVVESDGHVLPVFEFGQRFVSALVIGDGFLEAVLPVKNVANIVVEACEAASFSNFSEYFARVLGGRKCTI